MADPSHPLGPLPTRSSAPPVQPDPPEMTVEHHPDGSRTYQLVPMLVDERQAARRAVEDARLLAAGRPTDQAAGLELAGRLEALGDLEMHALMSGAASKAFHESLGLRRAALARAPEDPAALKALCSALHGLANACEDQERYEEATALFAELITHRRTAVARDPADDRLTLYLADSLRRVGQFESERHYRYSPAAQGALAESLALFDTFVARHGAGPRLHSLRGQVLCLLAEDELNEGGHLDLARRWANEAGAVCATWEAAAPGDRGCASLRLHVKILKDRLAREAA